MAALTIPDLNNAKVDVDHMAALANSPELTAVDRLGRTKPTMEGLRQQYPNAEPAAEAAGLSAGAAATSAAAAAGSASTAGLAGADAAVARDSLMTAALLKDNTADGLAATSGSGAANRFFWVRGTGDVVATMYRNDAGVATLLGAMASAAAIAELRAIPVSGAEYAIQDGSDNASEYVASSTGTRYMLAVDANSVNGIPRSELRRYTRRAPNLRSSISHRLSYGQSLSLGSNAIHSLPTVDGGFFDSLMFNANGTTTAGPRAQEGSGTVAQNHASLIAYEERPLSGSSPTGNFEAPLGNGLRMIKRLLRDEDGILPADYEYQLLGSAPGLSNTAIAGLGKGSAPYQKLIDDVTYGLALAIAAGKSYCVESIWWSQGERDNELNTVRLTYKNALLQLYTDLNTDIKALTGQPNDIKLIGYQMTSYNQFTFGNLRPDIALAQLDAAKANANIILATNIYAIEHIASNNVHMTGLGAAMLAAYNGLCDKRVIVDQVAYPMLYPSRITRQGNILNVEFPDTGYALALSTTLFVAVANSGFTAAAVDGTTDNPITSVALVGPRRLRVVLTTAAAGFLRYGFSSWGGNLHDLCDIDAGAARDMPLYRPCLTFDEAFA